jgi:hypothetical protein
VLGERLAPELRLDQEGDDQAVRVAPGILGQYAHCAQPRVEIRDRVSDAARDLDRIKRADGPSRLRPEAIVQHGAANLRQALEVDDIIDA